MQTPELHSTQGALRWRDAVGLIAVLALAAGLRFGWPGVNSFAFDEARLSLIALRMARGGLFASVGMPSSAGVPNLPAAAWVFAIPYALSPDPLVATLFVALISTAAVGGLWLLARRAWGWSAALAAGLYFAASPYGVFYSRSIWAQDLLPVLAVVWVWSAYAARVERRRWALIVHAFIAGFAFQVHFAGAALGLASVYLFFRWRWWQRALLPILIGGGLALAALIPFAAQLLAQPALADQFRAAFGQPGRVDLTALQELIRLALAADWRYLTIGSLEPAGTPPALLAAAGVLLAAGAAGVVRLLPYPRPLSRRERGEAPASGTLRDTVANSISETASATSFTTNHKSLSPLPPGDEVVGPRSRREAASRPAGRTGHYQGPGVRVLAELTLAMLIAPLALFLRHSTPVFIHYLLVALPALALLVGASVRLVERRAWAAGALALTAALALAWTAQIAAIMPVAASTETPNGLGTPLNLTRAAAEGLPGQAPVVFFTHGDDPNVDGEAAVFDALWWNRPHRIVQGESLLVLPSTPSYLMATLAPFQAWEELVAAGLARDPLSFPRRAGAEPLVAAFYDGITEPSGFTPIAPPVAFVDGARLDGWRARRVGPRLRVDTLWTVQSLPTAGTYQQFHHLQTAQTLGGGLFKGADVPLSANRWQVGDRLIVIGDFFDVAAGQYWVEVGHYTLPDVARVPRADGSSDPARIGPFDVVASAE